MFRLITGFLSTIPFILFIIALNTIQDRSNAFMYSGIGIYAVIIILILTFGIHVFRSNNVPVEKRKLWLAVLIFGNIVAFPVYWYLYVYKTHSMTAIAPEADR